MLPDKAHVSSQFNGNQYFGIRNRVLYICEIQIGETADPDALIWRIKKIFYVGITSRVKGWRWAEGSNEFKFAANLRESYDYGTEP